CGVVQAEDGIRDWSVTGVQTCALPISSGLAPPGVRGDDHSDDGGEPAGVVRRGLDHEHRAARGRTATVHLAEVDPMYVAAGCHRSEERRVGKRCRCRGWTDREKMRGAE